MTAGRKPGRIVVIGCGPTGCGIAWRLQEMGFHDFLVLEAAGGPGGLASSVVDPEGFTWDLGGHVQFSHYSYYDRVLDQAVADGWLWHDRESWIWIDSRWVPYPFQNNIHRLEPARRDAILEGLRKAAAHQGETAPRHFSDWILQTFGRPLAEAFMLPYNFKVWGYPLDQMDWGWIGERVAVPDVERIERSVSRQRDDRSWGPNDKFRFPLSGGTGAIWKGVGGRLPLERIRYGCAVISVDTARRELRLDNGETIGFDTLVSSIPLDSLVAISQPLPTEVREAAGRLRHSSSHILGIGLAGGRPETLDTKCWMYFPSAETPYYRVTVFSNYSPNLVPEGEGLWSLMAEVCETERRPVDTASLREWTLASLRADGLVRPDAEIRSFWHQRLEHGYPTPFLGRDRVLETVHSALEGRGIYSRGRFGGWKYEVSNQDHSFMQGVELADRLLDGKAEVTFRDPARANSGVFLTEEVRG